MTVTDTMLLAYVDGELDEAGVREVEQVIAGDAQARRTVEMYRDTASLLRAACGEQAYAAGAAALLPLRARPRQALPRRLVWAAAAAVALGIGLGAGGTWLGVHQSDLSQLVDEIAEYHAVFSHETAHLAEVPADRAQELAQWLGERLQRHLEIPELSAAGLRFAGGRMLVVDGAPVAQLMYTRPMAPPIAVCLGQMEGPPQPLAVLRRGPLRLAVWQEHGYAFLVVGEMSADLARDLAGRVKAQMRG
jgi:anti-sigma factor RsiW